MNSSRNNPIYRHSGCDVAQNRGGLLKNLGGNNIWFAFAGQIARRDERRISPANPTKWVRRIVRFLYRRHKRASTFSDQQHDRVVVQIVNGDINFAVTIEIGCNDTFRAGTRRVSTCRRECAVAVPLQNHDFALRKVCYREVLLTLSQLAAHASITSAASQ